MSLDLYHLAAFADGNDGGNPAGVAICDCLPTEPEMLALAAELGYSETAFLCPQDDSFRIRYFAPETEVPFCGHATIASGAQLGKLYGAGVYSLTLNDGTISVEAIQLENGQCSAKLISPPSNSRPADPDLARQACDLFGITFQDLHPQMPPAIASAGATHLILAMRSRQQLAEMDYDLAAGKALMQAHQMTTIMLVWPEAKTRFHCRNAFAIGGVLEDPATGAAAAAFGGFLRDIRWIDQGALTIRQGEDMGMPSEITVQIPANRDQGLTVSGLVRDIKSH